MFQGFANVEDIEPAVMEQHGDLPEDEIQNMRQQLKGFKSFYDSLRDSIPLCSSQAIVPGIAFRNDFNFRLRRERLTVDDELK